MKYFLNGNWYEKYSGVNIRVEGNVVGEKYKIKIDPDNPDRYVPIDWCPVFSEDDTTAYSSAVIVKVYRYRFSFSTRPDLSSFGVRFKYEIYGEEYERGQHLPPQYETMFSELKAGQSYEIEYLQADPRRAIIHLDRPINDN